MARKLDLGENHRRALSVLLRGIHRMCGEVEQCFVESSSALETVADDLSHWQKEVLWRKTAEVRREIGRIASEIVLDASVLSIRRKVYALISASIINLEESEPKNLLGYGPLGDSAIKRLDEEFAQLLALLEDMASIIEADGE